MPRGAAASSGRRWRSRRTGSICSSPSAIGSALHRRRIRTRQSARSSG
jgi:hypothetical protein